MELLFTDNFAHYCTHLLTHFLGHTSFFFNVDENIIKKDPCILQILTSKENLKIIQIIFISLLYLFTPFYPLRVRKIHNKMKAKNLTENAYFLIDCWWIYKAEDGVSFYRQLCTLLHTLSLGHTSFLLLPLIYRQSIYKWQVRIQVRINFKWLDGRKNIYGVQRFGIK